MFDKFDFSKMGDLLQNAQSAAQKIQSEQESKEYTAKSGGGMIEVKVNGKSEVLDINIDSSLLEDKESLQILLISAINDAIKMSEDDKKNMAAQMLSSFGNFSQ